MGKLLENLITKEIEEAFSILKRKKIIQEAELPKDDPAAPAPTDPSIASSDPVNPTADPMADITGVGDPGAVSTPTGADDLTSGADAGTNPEGKGESETGEPTEEPEEPEDPIETAFNDIKELSDKTEDITKIIKIIKAKLQDDFDSKEEAMQLVDKIKQEGSPLMKKALGRPELRFVKIQNI